VVLPNGMTTNCCCVTGNVLLHGIGSDWLVHWVTGPFIKRGRVIAGDKTVLRTTEVKAENTALFWEGTNGMEYLI
jgi:hypothetical protein